MTKSDSGGARKHEEVALTTDLGGEVGDARVAAACVCGGCGRGWRKRRVWRRILREVVEGGGDVPNDLLHVKNALRQCVLRAGDAGAALAAFCAISFRRVAVADYAKVQRVKCFVASLMPLLWRAAGGKNNIF
jgi:hypothetical protein